MPVPSEEAFSLRLELYYDVSETLVYLNGSLALRTSALYTDSSLPSATEHSFFKSHQTSGVVVDDLRSESLLIPYIKPSADLKNEEDDSSEISFDYTSIGNLPAKVATTLGKGSYVELPEVMNNRTGETSKALMLHTASGNNDVLRMYTTEKMSNSTCIAFEADIMIDTAVSGIVYQLCMDSEYTRAYMINVKASGGVISMYDAANKGGALAAVHTNLSDNVAKVGEWFNLRIEFYKGNADTVRFKIFVNGEHIATSSNYYRSSDSDAPINSITGCYFYTMLASNADIYIENVSIVESAATYSEK